VSKLLEETGMAVKIAHPYKVRLIAESTQKHDQGDARMLASLLRAGYFPEAKRCSDRTYELRLLLREREFLVQMRTRAKNRLHGIATTSGYWKNPLYRRNRDTSLAELPQIAHELYALIEELTKRIKPFDILLRDRGKHESLAPLLMSIPGVGPLTALTMIAEVEDFGRFSNPGKLASYAGLIPRQRSSGGKTRMGSITNQGSARLRTAMVEAAMRIRPEQEELYAFYARLLPHCGAKRARVALGRKLLTLSWHMVKNMTSYQERFSPSSRIANASDLATSN
jgi:transposase